LTVWIGNKNMMKKEREMTNVSNNTFHRGEKK